MKVRHFTTKENTFYNKISLLSLLSTHDMKTVVRNSMSNFTNMISLVTCRHYSPETLDFIATLYTDDKTI